MRTAFIPTPAVLNMELKKVTAKKRESKSLRQPMEVMCLLIMQSAQQGGSAADSNYNSCCALCNTWMKNSSRWFC